MHHEVCSTSLAQCSEEKCLVQVQQGISLEQLCFWAARGIYLLKARKASSVQGQAKSGS